GHGARHVGDVHALAPARRATLEAARRALAAEHAAADDVRADADLPRAFDEQAVVRAEDVGGDLGDRELALDLLEGAREDVGLEDAAGAVLADPDVADLLGQAVNDRAVDRRRAADETTLEDRNERAPLGDLR